MTREIIRQGEARLAAQLQAALAADARAGVIASLEAAASVALIVFAAGDTVIGAAEASCYVAAVTLLLGALAAVISARPVDFGMTGMSPKDWVTAIDTNEPEVDALKAYADYLGDDIALNAQHMKSNGWLVTLALAALPIAPAAAFITTLLAPHIGLDPL